MLRHSAPPALGRIDRFPPSAPFSVLRLHHRLLRSHLNPNPRTPSPPRFPLSLLSQDPVVPTCDPPSPSLASVVSRAYWLALFTPVARRVLRQTSAPLHAPPPPSRAPLLTRISSHCRRRCCPPAVACRSPPVAVPYAGKRRWLDRTTGNGLFWSSGLDSDLG
jgi:hypothetical protein